MKPRSNHIKKKQSLLPSRPARLRAAASGSDEPVNVVVRKPSRRKWLMIVLALVGIATFSGTWAILEFVVWARVPPELVGKWVVRGGPDTGSTLDFSRSGTMISRIKNPELQGVFEIEAQIRVRGKRILCTFRNLETGEEGTRVQVIKSLDATHLVLEDEQGRSVSLDRAD